MAAMTGILSMLLSISFLQVSAQLPISAVVLRASPDVLLFEGESLTLMCLTALDESNKSISQSHNALAYSIERDQLTMSTSSQTLRIEKVTKSQTGRYRCSITDHTGARSYSQEVQVTVEEGVVKPILTVEPSAIGVYSEDTTVTLTCQLPGQPGWRFYWYRDTLEAPPVEQVWSRAGGPGVYRVSRPSLSRAGQYRCRAGRGEPVYYTPFSQAVNVSVPELFSSVTLQVLPSAVVKEGATLHLTCEAEVIPSSDSESLDVSYSFVKDGVPVVKDSGSRTYSIAMANRCHMGTYRCVARAGGDKRSSQEVVISLDRYDCAGPSDSSELSLILVTSLGSFFVLAVAPLAFAVRHCGIRLLRLREQHGGMQPNNRPTFHTLEHL